MSPATWVGLEVPSNMGGLGGFIGIREVGRI